MKEMDRSLAYYKDGLGLEVAFDIIIDGPYLPVALGLEFDSIRAVYLALPGGGFLELLEYRGIDRLHAAARPCDYGAGHLCLYVTGIDELWNRLAQMGHHARSSCPVDVIAGPNTGARMIYLIDPDGYSLELFQRP